MTTPSHVLCLDVGNRRIGVAIASTAALLARTVETIDRNHTDALDRLEKLVAENNVNRIIIGLPRDMNGNETNQTAVVREFASQVEERLKLPVEFMDEAATSLAATEWLERRGKPYGKGDVDMQAAYLILDDWLRTHERAADL